MTETALAVNAVGLTKRYGRLVAVNELSMAVAEGEVYGVLGPNGAGKTTFLRMLFGLIRPDSGTLQVLGRTWQADGPQALDGVAGFIESPKFYPYLSGRKNLELLAGLDGSGSASRIDGALDLVDLTGREGDKVGGYSFGMRQRLGVAASLIRQPRLLVLDEPANGLDPGGIRDITTSGPAGHVQQNGPDTPIGQSLPTGWHVTCGPTDTVNTTIVDVFAICATAP